MATLTAAAKPVKTRVLFDATRKLPKPLRDRLARFGVGLESETGPWVHTPTLGTWNPTLFAGGPRVENLPQSDAELNAFEAGHRCGCRRIDERRIMSFHGWTEGMIRAFWLGHRTGWRAEETRRLAEQAEVDARFDAAYADSRRPGDDGSYGYE